MKIEENILVGRGYRIFELVWRGFYFRDKSPSGKAKKKRFKEHANLCFYHANRLFRKYNREQNLGWERWDISILRPCPNGNFYLKTCIFKISKKG